MSKRILLFTTIFSLFFAIPALADDADATATPEATETPIGYTVKYDFNAGDNEVFCPPLRTYSTWGNVSSLYYYDSATSSFVNESGVWTRADSGTFSFFLNERYVSELSDGYALVLIVKSYPDFNSCTDDIFYSMGFDFVYAQINDFSVYPTTSPNKSISSKGYIYSASNFTLRYRPASTTETCYGKRVYLGSSLNSTKYSRGAVTHSTYSFSESLFKNSRNYCNTTDDISYYKSYELYNQVLYIPFFQYMDFDYPNLPDFMSYDDFTMSISSNIPIYIFDDVTDTYYKISDGSGNPITLGDDYVDLTQDGILTGLQPVDPNMTTSGGKYDFNDAETSGMFSTYAFDLIWGCSDKDHYFVNEDDEIEFCEAGSYHYYNGNFAPQRDLGVYWIDNGIYSIKQIASGYGVSVSTVIYRYLNSVFVNSVGEKSGGKYTADELYNMVNSDNSNDIYTRLGDVGTILLNMDTNLVNLGTYLNNMATNLYTQVSYLTGTMNDLLTSINKNIASQSGVDLSPVTELLKSIDFNTQYTLNAISNWEKNLATDMTSNMTSWFNNVLANQGTINDNIGVLNTNLLYVLSAISNWEGSLDLKLDASDSWFGSVLSYLSDINSILANWDSSLHYDETDDSGNTIWDSIKAFVAGALLDDLIDAISEGLHDAFVPSDNYFKNKFKSWLSALAIKSEMDTYLALTLSVNSFATSDKPSFTLGDTFAGIESSVSSKRETYAEGTYEYMAVSSFDSLTEQISDVELIDFSIFDDYKTIINAVTSSVIMFGFILWCVHQLQKTTGSGGES